MLSCFSNRVAWLPRCALLALRSHFTAHFHMKGRNIDYYRPANWSKSRAYGCVSTHVQFHVPLLITSGFKADTIKELPLYSLIMLWNPVIENFRYTLFYRKCRIYIVIQYVSQLGFLHKVLVIRSSKGSVGYMLFYRKCHIYLFHRKCWYMLFYRKCWIYVDLQEALYICSSIAGVRFTTNLTKRIKVNFASICDWSECKITSTVDLFLCAFAVYVFR